jgi:hypothetical protein
MSRIMIVMLMYHRHKAPDLIYSVCSYSVLLMSYEYPIDDIFHHVSNFSIFRSVFEVKIFYSLSSSSPS